MLLKGMNENNGWMFTEYQATWPYGYDFMLDAAQSVIDTDFKGNLQRVAVGAAPGAGQEECLEEVRKFNNLLHDCPTMRQEHGVLIVSGLSEIMNCPLQLMFYNQTNIIRICTSSKSIFSEDGANAFTNYVCSIEIKAYCAATERETLEQQHDV